MTQTVRERTDGSGDDLRPRLVAIVGAPRAPAAVLGWGEPPGCTGTVTIPLTPHRPLAALRREARRRIATLDDATCAALRSVGRHGDAGR